MNETRLCSPHKVCQIDTELCEQLSAQRGDCHTLKKNTSKTNRRAGSPVDMLGWLPMGPTAFSTALLPGPLHTYTRSILCSSTVAHLLCLFICHSTHKSPQCLVALGTVASYHLLGQEHGRSLRLCSSLPLKHDGWSDFI